MKSMKYNMKGSIYHELTQTTAMYTESKFRTNAHLQINFKTTIIKIID